MLCLMPSSSHTLFYLIVTEYLYGVDIIISCFAQDILRHEVIPKASQLESNGAQIWTRSLREGHRKKEYDKCR